jgi:hypothetical protein
MSGGGAALARTPLTKRHLLYDLSSRHGSETGGSRERPSVWLFYPSIEKSQSTAPGNSREPPAFDISQLQRVIGRDAARSKGYRLKRLPSSRPSCVLPLEFLQNFLSIDIQK